MTWLVVIMLACTGLVYSGMILCFTLGWFRTLRKTSAEGPSPKSAFSIILPVRNEEHNIEKVLFSLSKQDFLTPGSEVIVLDDGSDDHTAELAERAIIELGSGRFRLIRLMPGVGKKSAITTGVSLARGEIILTTDADCLHPPGWVIAMTEVFRDPETMMACGPVRSAPGKGLLKGFQELEFLGLVLSGAGAAEMGHAIYCNGANLAYRKSAFQAVGGYSGNEKFASGDDVFLLHKVKRQFGGSSIRFAGGPSGWVSTEAPGTLTGFLEQRARWASKSKGYRDPAALSVAMAVFLFNILLLATAGIAISGVKIAGSAAMIAWVFKIIVDLPLLYSGTRYLGRQKLMAAYPLFQAIYPFYILGVSLRMAAGGVRWKDSR